jgi:hypothetical protein
MTSGTQRVNRAVLPHLRRQKQGLLVWVSPVARTTSSLRDQTRRTFSPVGLQEPEYLAALKPQQLRRRLGRQPLMIQIAQHFKPRQFPVAH